jgi:hypothetical protein
MNWQERAATSHYQTAVAIQHELQAGRHAEATAGLEELIDALARAEKRALKSHLVRLMAHIIKWQTQPTLRSRSWASSIRNARREIRDIQEETPSLTDDVLRSLWDKCFLMAKEEAEGEMNQDAAITSLSWDEVFQQDYSM